MRYSRLLPPFVMAVLAFVGARLAVAPIGDAAAHALASVAHWVLPAPSAPGVEEESASLDANDDARDVASDEGASPSRPRRRASRGTRAARVATASLAAAIGDEASSIAKDPKDGGAGGSEVVKGTIVVPASVVTNALEHRSAGATNATNADGSPLGAKLHGVSRYRTGVRDGDVVIAVEGVRTPTVAAMVSRAMQVAGAGASRLSGKIRRGDAFYVVVIELPR